MESEGLLYQGEKYCHLLTCLLASWVSFLCACQSDLFMTLIRLCYFPLQKKNSHSPLPPVEHSISLLQHSDTFFAELVESRGDSRKYTKLDQGGSDLGLELLLLLCESQFFHWAINYDFFLTYPSLAPDHCAGGCCALL